jgi:hypothetical protein
VSEFNLDNSTLTRLIEELKAITRLIEELKAIDPSWSHDQVRIAITAALDKARTHRTEGSTVH